MSTIKPTAQARSGPWFDDPNIANDDTVPREVRSYRHLVKLADGSWGVSPQLFTSQNGGCSVELKSLYEAEGFNAQDRISGSYDLGGAELNVGAVRGVMNRLDDKKKPISPLGVAYTPIGEGEIDGPNSYHCDIFARTGNSALGNPGRNNLHKIARPVHMKDHNIIALLQARDEKLAT